MKALSAIAILTLTLVNIAATQQQSIPPKVTHISTKIVRGPDKEGDVFFAVKCTVHNQTDSKQTYIICLQGVDVQGYELKAIYLKAAVNPRSWETVSTHLLMPERQYKMARWKLKSWAPARR